jgi:tryptophan 2,3-dioxygenase
MGLQMNKRHDEDYYKRTNEGGFTKEDFNHINKVEEKPSIQQLINKWLERLPFFDGKYWGDFTDNNNDNVHPFWNAYRNIYKEGLTEREAQKINDFDFVFFDNVNEITNSEEQNSLRSSFSAKGLQAALFIMLYRDFPMFQTSYQILDSLIEIDHLMATWRHKHLVMVRRMIGMRVGTGNTSGAGYLEGALNKHFVYKELSGLSTYLIERKKLPKLPEKLTKELGFYSY